jgi:hypothetical protein
MSTDDVLSDDEDLAVEKKDARLMARLLHVLVGFGIAVW